MSPTDIRPEPVWGVAQPEVEPCSSFESGATPIMITGFIVRLLQYHFYDPGNIMHEMLKSYRWQPDCAKGIVQPDNSILRPIHVGTSYEFTPGNVQRAPERLRRTAAICLHALSMVPLPIKKPSWRKRA